MSTSKDSTTNGCDSLPLPVPLRPWHTVGIDYLTHLPVSNGFEYVLIVVDHPTRMAYFMPCAESVTAEEIAALFLHGVYQLHGLLRVLVSDRDPKFFSGLWQTCLPVDTRRRTD
jgi:hypothetical protein